MADSVDRSYSFSFSSTQTVRDTGFLDMTRKRDLVISIEFSAFGNTTNASDTLQLIIQGSNSPEAISSTYINSDDYWQTYITKTFTDTALASDGLATTKLIYHYDEVDAADITNRAKGRKIPPKYVRAKLICTDTSGSAVFTGVVRFGYNEAVTSS